MNRPKDNQILTNEKGFTLIEIIAVLVILGILAAVATPKFMNLQEDARVSASKAAIAEIKSRLSIGYGQYLLRSDGKQPTTAAQVCTHTVSGKAYGVNDITVLPASCASASFTIGDFKVKITTNAATVTITGIEAQDVAIPAANNPQAPGPCPVSRPVPMAPAGKEKPPGDDWMTISCPGAEKERMRPDCSLSCNAGFTMVEIIAVMVIIGILGALAASRRVDDSSREVSSRDRVRAHIRYAQLLAMKSNTVSGLDFKGTGYTIFTNNSTSNLVSLGEGTAFSMPAGMTATITIYFDHWGIPYTAYTDPDTNTPWPAPDQAIGSLGLTMTADTGFVR